MKNHNVRGFTLIELVVVVVLLGLLAAIAVPKYIDLTEQAQQANIEGMAGGFSTGISLARSQWEAEGRPYNGTYNVVNYDGSNLILTTENQNQGVRPGYPIGLQGGDDQLDLDDCVDIWNNILQQPPLVTQELTKLNSSKSDSYKYLVDIAGTGSTSYCIYYLKETLDKENDNYKQPQNVNVGNNFTYTPANSSVVININQD